MAIITDFCRFLRTNKYTVYVLVVLMSAYLINQLNVFCLIATNNSMAQEIKYGDRECQPGNTTSVDNLMTSEGYNGTAASFCKSNPELCPNEENSTSPCNWRYLGSGVAYQLLAGPLYVVIFSISGIPMGLVSELQNINRKILLAGCVVLWSVMCGLGGLATQYWHLAVTRLLLGVFSAGCVPFAASLIADYYSENSRGAALGFFNWGIYLGYSLTFLFIIAERKLGWRAVYFIAGAPGVAVGLIILLTVREPARGAEKDKQDGQQETKRMMSNDKAPLNLTEQTGISARTRKLRQAAKMFLKPQMLMLCLGGAIRNGAGIVWAYNIRNFFSQYHPGTYIESWMSWIPLVFGSLGAFGGGALSDKLSANRGPRGRLMVLIGCLLLSAPFQVGTLYLPMPWAFISHIPAYLIGEMWIGVCAAIVISFVPEELTTSAIAVYFFIIQIIGGNMNLFVTPIRQAIDLRSALLITFPGLYVIGAVLFIITFFLVPQADSKYEITQPTVQKDSQSEPTQVTETE